jgi:hypothetical protein
MMDWLLSHYPGALPRGFRCSVASVSWLNRYPSEVEVMLAMHGPTMRRTDVPIYVDTNEFMSRLSSEAASVGSSISGILANGLTVE